MYLQQRESRSPWNQTPWELTEFDFHINAFDWILEMYVFGHYQVTERD